jgi:hypothetical protein
MGHPRVTGLAVVVRIDIVSSQSVTLLSAGFEDRMVCGD